MVSKLCALMRSPSFFWIEAAHGRDRLLDDLPAGVEEGRG